MVHTPKPGSSLQASLPTAKPWPNSPPSKNTKIHHFYVHVTTSMSPPALGLPKDPYPAYLPICPLVYIPSIPIFPSQNKTPVLPGGFKLPLPCPRLSPG